MRPLRPDAARLPRPWAAAGSVAMALAGGLAWAGPALGQYGAPQPGYGMPGPMPQGQAPQGQMLQGQLPMQGGMPNGMAPGGMPNGMAPGQPGAGAGWNGGFAQQQMPQQQMPQQQPGPFGMAPPGNGYGQPNAGPGNPQAQLAALDAMERQDFGVPPSTGLHGGAMHAPTPAQVPGAQVITTMQLVQLVQSGARPVVVDVLGGQQSLPGAIPASMGGAGGSFQDGNQAQFVGLLQQATGGDTSRPVVVYCLNPHCWLSYNAALRAVNGGFTRVYWYRGGIETWSQVGLPVMASAQRQAPDTSGGNGPGGYGPGMAGPGTPGPNMGQMMAPPGQFAPNGGQQQGGFGMGGWNGGRPTQ